jgi:hypothetical protein
MPTIRIRHFAGEIPNIDGRQLPDDAAQIALNCLLTDGTLRPMPQWTEMQGNTYSIGEPSAGNIFNSYPGYFGMSFYGPPFGQANILLDDTGTVNTELGIYPGQMTPPSGSVSLVPGYLSQKAVNRLYAASSVGVYGNVVYETALTILPGLTPESVVYEGDIATLTLSGGNAAINLYRSTSDVTGGAGTNQAVTANWQLVAQLPGASGTYIDSGAAIADGFDTYLYRGSLVQPFSFIGMGEFESGYIWGITSDGQVAVADRFSWGYWPVENVYSLQNAPGNNGIQVTGFCAVGDALYIGTQLGVFSGVIKVTEEAQVVLGLYYIPDSPPCLPFTMVETPTGAMYTAAQGVVAVNGPQCEMVSRGVARGIAGHIPGGGEVLFVDTGNAVYHNGRYYGIANQPQG